VSPSSGSDEIAEKARRLAKRRTFNPGRFLAVFERGDYVDIDPQAVPAVQRDLVLPVLRAMVNAESGTVRLNAASALFKFGDPVGCSVLIDCLQSQRPEIRRRALDRLISSGIGNRKRSYNLPIDANGILTALEPSVADTDAWTRERALMVMGYLATPRTFDRLVRLLQDSRHDVRARKQRLRSAALAKIAAQCWSLRKCWPVQIFQDVQNTIISSLRWSIYARAAILKREYVPRPSLCGLCVVI
jgi:hypothetical protein